MNKTRIKPPRRMEARIRYWPANVETPECAAGHQSQARKRIEQQVDPPAIIRIYDDIAAGLKDATHLFHSTLCRRKPGYNTDCQYKLKMTRTEGEVIDVRQALGHAVVHTGTQARLPRESGHCPGAINRVNAVPALRERNSHQTGSTPNLEYRGPSGNSALVYQSQDLRVPVLVYYGEYVAPPVDRLPLRSDLFEEASDQLVVCRLCPGRLIAPAT
ncbi:MAG TPA: hypothetical protein VN428_21455 [Bryobacteraceae bacterium]|nr:hypothetical protein [Bryobacteraceae bacterium]